MIAPIFAPATADTLGAALTYAERGWPVVPFGEREWHAAVAAFLRFGRGRHAAALNFGDCLAYAAAVVANDSLLFVGDDFGLTDVKAA